MDKSFSPGAIKHILMKKEIEVHTSQLMPLSSLKSKEILGFLDQGALDIETWKPQDWRGGHASQHLPFEYAYADVAGDRALLRLMKGLLY